MDSGETQLRNQGCFGVLGRTRRQLGGIGSGPTVRLACRGAGRPRSRPSSTTETTGKKPPKPSPPISPAASPAPSYATADTKAPAVAPVSTSTAARRLDENLEGRIPHSDHSSPTGPVSAPNPATEPGRPIPVTAPEPRVIDQAQLEAALTRLPAPLATQLARLATRHRIRHSDQ